MECFIHTASPAVGICKSCGRGICRNCAMTVPNGLACSEECKTIAESLGELQMAQIRNLRTTSAQRIVLPFCSLVLLSLGAVLVARGDSGVFAWFYILMGAGTGWALLMARNKRAQGSIPSKS